MNWTADGPCCYLSDDGKWSITRAPAIGFPAVYALILLGVKKGETWAGSERVMVERAATEAERAAAVKRLQERANA